MGLPRLSWQTQNPPIRHTHTRTHTTSTPPPPFYGIAAQYIVYYYTTPAHQARGGRGGKARFVWGAAGSLKGSDEMRWRASAGDDKYIAGKRRRVGVVVFLAYALQQLAQCVCFPPY